MMSKQLFKDFESVSSKQWKQKIQADLKGADYNSTLIWNTNEGIDVKPFYHQDDFNTLPNASNTKAASWKICETIKVNTALNANTIALDVINRGAESICFVIDDSTISIESLFKGINVPIYIKTNFLSETFINTCKSLAKKALIVHTDIIGNLAKTGNWYTNLKDDHKKLEAIVETTSQISIHVDAYQNAGASIVQQLAYAIAHINEYLNHFNELDTNLNNTLSVVFNVAVGTNYFFEIAKIRALRLLWTSLANQYNNTNECTIFVTPTKRNKTLYDYNTNMLRTTTECMSAVLGGANVINNLPYDAIYHNDNEFGSRIARNQLLILKHESYFDKVNNPADGSYYIETLTNELAEKALHVFKDIEVNGGFLNQLKQGTIQRKIKESASKEQTEFNNGNLVLLGTNKYTNSQDKMATELELHPFITIDKRKTLIEPIIAKRIAEAIDQKRLKTE